MNSNTVGNLEIWSDLIAHFLSRSYQEERYTPEVVWFAFESQHLPSEVSKLSRFWTTKTYDACFWSRPYRAQTIGSGPKKPSFCHPSGWQGQPACEAS